MLSVAHLPASLRFYTELLGGEPSYRFPADGDAVFVTLRLGASELGLGQLGDGPALHGQAQRPAAGHRIELCAYVRQLEQRVERMRAEQVPILLEPSLQPWGERVAYVADPDGNLILLIDDVEAPAGP
jgi:lactoylglutathione lyase